MSTALRLDLTWTDPPGAEPEAGPALAWGEAILYVVDTPVWFSGSVDAPVRVAWS